MSGPQVWEVEVWETLFSILQASIAMGPGRTEKEGKRMSRVKQSREALLLSMTMMESAAMAMLDCIAEERAALREEIENEAAKGERCVIQ